MTPLSNLTSASQPPKTAANPSDPAGSKWIGRYKLLQEIGEGGMGTVWMAEQEEPVRRRVALKVIKTGMDTKQVIARFEAERQALALMDHQNIARVLDAGTTDEGLPYFVMELVKGIPYVEYCNKNRLSIEERLKLFVPVCKAVQHAHQKGIIHRDLKPSNVLVTLYDGHPVPKVIDFGLAKALDQQAKLTDRTMFTEFGQVVGTLQYMSPEQAEMNALDVDTRTDVYSLGVMLYELLTGTTPIEMKTLKQNALMKVLQDIRETDPPRPSIRLSESGEAVSGYSEQRKIEPARLQQLLRGELDWIVMKSLEKNRTRRYETASAFVDDIQRYLADEAVEARPASARYLFGKFVKKHRGLVATVAALAAVLVAGIIGTSYGLVEANRKTAEVVQQKQRADDEATNARAAEEIAKLKEAEAATEASKSRAAEELAKQNEQRAVFAQNRAVFAQNQVEQTLARSNFFLATSRWRDGRFLESQEFLKKIPPAFRDVEWGLLRQLQRCEMTCYGHMGEVRQVGFTADQSRIISAGFKIKVWDAATGNEIDEIDFTKIKSQKLGLNPAGNQIAVSTDNKIKLFDLSTGKVLRTFSGQHEGYVLHFRFSNNGKQIATKSNDETIKLWDTQNGKLLHTISLEKNDLVRDICYSPDGKWIAVAGRALTLWNTNDGSQLKTFDLKKWSLLRCICVSPDGRWIATGNGDHTIKLWDVATKQELRTYTGHVGTVTCVSFSPDGQQIVSGSDDGTVKLWNTDSSQPVSTYRGHTAGVTSVVFSPDGTRIVSGSKDATVKVWNATEANNFRLIRGNRLHASNISFSSDGKRIASASLGSAPRIWDAATGEEICTMKGEHVSPYCVAFKHDGTQIVSGQNDGTIRLWDASNGDELLTIRGHQRNVVTSVSFSPDDTLIVSTGLDKTSKLWDAKTGKEIRQWRDEKRPIKEARFSRDGKRLIMAHHAGEISSWDVASGDELELFQDYDPSAAQPCLAISADGKQIASGSFNATIKIWDETGKLTTTLQGHKNPIRSLSFSPDGKRIVSVSGGIVLPSNDHTVKLWDVATGEELISLSGRPHQGSNILFSPDGSMIAWAESGVDPAIRLWDVTTFKEEIEKRLRGIGYRVPKVTSSDDGAKIIISDGTKDTVVWDKNSDEFGTEPPMIVPSMTDIIIVDRNFKNSPKEQAFRQFNAKLDPSFHATQAVIAEEKKDWYAAAFHRAWELKADPNRRTSPPFFRIAYKKLQAQYGDKEQDLADFVSPVVIEAAELPKLKFTQSTIPDTEAEEINRKIWKKVRSPKLSAVKDGVAAITQTEIDLLRSVCKDYSLKGEKRQQYQNTLLVAEYRLNHLGLAVSAENSLIREKSRSIELAKQAEQGQRDSYSKHAEYQERGSGMVSSRIGRAGDDSSQTGQ